MNVKDSLVTLISYLLKPAKRKSILLSIKQKNKTGLEIGGPSTFFGLKSYFPVYVFADQVDGVNFSTETVWEGTIKEGLNYKYFHEKKGYQYISEASDLSKINDAKYDFIVSCHSLEHVANVIKTVNEWNRVLIWGGALILVLPDKEHTFDHNRPYTTFEHLEQDFQSNIDEHDETAFPEIIELLDIKMDNFLNSKVELIARLKNNFDNRCAHHHVFSLELTKELLEYCKFKVVYQQKMPPFHLFTYAIKE